MLISSSLRWKDTVGLRALSVSREVGTGRYSALQPMKSQPIVYSVTSHLKARTCKLSLLDLLPALRLELSCNYSNDHSEEEGIPFSAHSAYRAGVRTDFGSQHCSACTTWNHDQARVCRLKSTQRRGSLLKQERQFYCGPGQLI